MSPSPPEPSASDRERAKLRLALIGLSVACPYDQGNPASCQLCAVRTWPIAKRVAWVEHLPTKEMCALFQTHQQCLRALERGEKK